MIPYEEFAERAGRVRERIAEACARARRRPDEVELLAVTKTHPAAAVDYAARYGLRGVGENRVQEGVAKRAETSAPVRWELIGHLQSNKAALAARHFDRIQSVDSEKLVEQLARAAAALGRRLPILLEINAGDDPAKFGASVEGADRLLEAALSRPDLAVEGLMTIAPLSEDPAVAARAFTRLRELRDRLSGAFSVPLRELSMGMTSDLAEAVAAGSTQVRIGTALYGARE
jgi:pyridoxal phosphate enzyme (YggS family)